MRTVSTWRKDVKERIGTPAKPAPIMPTCTNAPDVDTLPGGVGDIAHRKSTYVIDVLNDYWRTRGPFPKLVVMQVAQSCISCSISEACIKSQ